MKEHASTGAIPADASEEMLVNELAGMAYEAECLADSIRPANGPLGRFGRYVAINPIQP